MSIGNRHVVGRDSAALIGHGGRPGEPTYLFVCLIATYVAFQAFAVLTSSGLLKALSYAFAFGIVLLVVALAIYMPKGSGRLFGLWFALTFYLYGCIGSALFNLANLDYGVAVKMLLVPPLALAGAVFESRNQFLVWGRRNTRWFICALLVLPYVLWLGQIAAGRVSFDGSSQASVFVNRNIAGLYAITLAALFNVLRPRPIKNIFFYLGVGVLFGTLGVLLAVALALLVAVGRWQIVVVLGVVLFICLGIYYFVPLDFWVFARIGYVVATLKLIFSGRIDIATTSYAELVSILNTKDLSFVFRLKHWFDLWLMYIEAPLEVMVFGFGVGSSVRLSEAGLVPHNDYLRILFECGPVAFFGFAFLLVVILRGAWGSWELVPLLAVSIYFFSENLIDNFPAMSIFFFCGGSLAYRIRSQQPKAQAMTLGFGPMTGGANRKKPV